MVPASLLLLLPRSGVYNELLSATRFDGTRRMRPRNRAGVVCFLETRRVVCHGNQQRRRCESRHPGADSTGAEYVESLRGRNLKVYLFGELVDEPVDHPVIRPSINAVAETYDLAARSPELGTAVSPYTGERINRFLHIAGSPEDLVMQNKMQRRLGQLTGTCFQRCVGMDAFNSLHSVTFEIDEAHGTAYHERFCRVRHVGAAAGLRHRRRHDRRQRRSQQGAA